MLGSTHRLTPPHLPHNSLYVISDEGEVVDRYDKRYCSHTEVNGFYTPGSAVTVFEVDGFHFGCAICIARPWRATALDGDIYRSCMVDDRRSTARTAF